MASTTLIPVSEYLAASYHPDRDYIDGEVKERNMGEQPHSLVQGVLARIFGVHRYEWGVRVHPEQRVQITSNRFRIPDVCILRRTDARDPVVRFAPLLCIEILSEGDSMSELQEKVDDYASLGVEHIWVIDPWKRRAWYGSNRGFDQPVDGVLRVLGTPIAVTLTDLFAELDED